MNVESINNKLATFKHKLGFERGSARASIWEQALKQRRGHDQIENARSAPPEDEYVDLCCMWAVEFYTPAHMDKLAEYAAHLDKAARSVWPNAPTISSWLNDAIGHPSRFSWMDLGTWLPKGSIHRDPLLDPEIDLPDSVSWATGRISSISSSIVAVVVCFVFDDEFSECFDRALRVDKTTYAVPHRVGMSFVGTEMQKQKDIDLIRVQMSERVASWFQVTIPGVFSGGLLGGQLPTCEFLTLRKAEPFAAPEQSAYPDGRYMRILGVDGDWTAWEYTPMPGLRFQPDSRSDNGPRFHSILAMNEQIWLNADMQTYGAVPRWGGVNFVSQLMPDVLCYWALWPLLVGYTGKITSARNSEANKIGKTTNVAKTLERVGGHMADLSDMEAIATDLAEIQLPRRMPSYDGARFKRCQSELYAENDNLLEMLVERTTERAKWLRITGQSLSNQFSQLGTMIAATKNVRLQSAITRLTVAMLLLTVFSAGLFATQIGLPSWIRPILDQAWSALSR